MPADCIYKVISQNGNRTLFERHSTLRPPPQVTLRSCWHSQQQQQSFCDDVDWCKESCTGQIGERDVRCYTTDDQTSTRKLVRDSEPVVDNKTQFEIDLRVEGVSQNAILQDDEKMKESNKKMEKFRVGLDHAQNQFGTICRTVK